MSKDLVIDAVILWVNGNEESYRKKLASHLPQDSDVLDGYKTRYQQVDEIQYNVNALLKYAPYLRHIFIVTDQQTPEFLKKTDTDSCYSKVCIIDHQIIFKEYEEFLPVFNSRSIETAIYRIPQLAEHFIYLNDDFFIINPTKKTDFFTSEGYPVLRGFWQKFDDKLKTRASHKTAQELAAKHLGFDQLYRFKHTPHPIRKSTLSNYFQKHPDLLRNNLKHKFRSNKQFLIVALANHLELKNKTFRMEKELNLAYFRSFKRPLFWYRYKLHQAGKKKLFLGLQSMNKAKESTLKYLISWLEKRTQV